MQLIEMFLQKFTLRSCQRGVLVEILESPVQLLDVLELHGRFFYPVIGILVHEVHLGHVAFELGLREEFGKLISVVVSSQHLLYFYMLVCHLLLDPQVLHLDMPCLSSEASPISNPLIALSSDSAVARDDALSLDESLDGGYVSGAWNVVVCCGDCPC